MHTPLWQAHGFCRLCVQIWQTQTRTHSRSREVPHLPAPHNSYTSETTDLSRLPTTHVTKVWLCICGHMRRHPITHLRSRSSLASAAAMRLLHLRLTHAHWVSHIRHTRPSPMFTSMFTCHRSRCAYASRSACRAPPLHMSSPPSSTLASAPRLMPLLLTQACW